VGAQAMLTIPMIGYIGSLGPNRSTIWSFSIAKYGPQTGWDPYNPDAGNGVSTAPGNPYITGNNPADASTPNSPSIQQAMGSAPDRHLGAGIRWRAQVLSDG
jgi:hypothetical protein